ncbi:VOC family protein [Rhodococcus aerolatus]
MTTPVTAHEDLHAEAGRLRGERADRHPDPVVKVAGLSRLELATRDLDRTERFARDFGLGVVRRSPDELVLRGAAAGPPCLLVRRGDAAGLTATVLAVDDRSDLDRLSRDAGSPVRALPGPEGGAVVDLTAPDGSAVRVVHGVADLPARPTRAPLVVNTAAATPRTNAVQRPSRAPSEVLALGHVVLQSTRFTATLDWYQRMFGLIASDYLFHPRARRRGPAMAFLRCDRGGVPADHHTVAMTLGTRTGYVHSAYQVADLDAVATGGAWLADRGYHHTWGIGRHVQGSQLFDYWRDPDDLLVEHFADGDVFDSSVEAGWTAMTASGLSQWGPPVTRDFLGSTPTPARVREVLTALREDNEMTPARLLGLLRVAAS